MFPLTCSLALPTMSRCLSILGMLVVLLIGPRAADSQWQQYSFTYDGLARDYWVFLPQNFQANMPAVVSLHGYSETFEWYRNYTMMHEVADTAGFVLVYPIGYARAWNSGAVDTRTIYDLDDVGFISAIIDTLHARYDVDLERVYCCGFSNGGEMTYRLACELGQRFAAVASVAGCLSDIAVNASWYPLRPMPVLHFHGTLDVFEYYNGNKPGFDLWSVPATLDFWIQRNSCVAVPETVWMPDVVPTDGCTVQKISYRNCSDSSRIIHYKIIDGGHSWPSSTFSYGAEGNKNMDINANVEMWNFFKEYANPLVNVAFGEHSLPKVFALEQNYPNPFNPSTTIRFDLPTSSEVRLSVFDMLGREVSALVNERREAGYHSVNFNASGFSSGVYFYRLQARLPQSTPGGGQARLSPEDVGGQAGDFVQTRKLLLIR